MNALLRLLGIERAAPDRTHELEDPSRVLEFAYRRQAASLDAARRTVAQILTTEKRLEIEARAFAHAGARHAGAARRAEAAGDSDAAGIERSREGFATAQRDQALAFAAGVRERREALEAELRVLHEQLRIVRTEKSALDRIAALARAAELDRAVALARAAALQRVVAAGSPPAEG